MLPPGVKSSVRNTLGLFVLCNAGCAREIGVTTTWRGVSVSEQWKSFGAAMVNSYISVVILPSTTYIFYKQCRLKQISHLGMWPTMLIFKLTL